MRKFISSVAVAALLSAGTSIVNSAPAQAYPGCFYNYGGCYLDPGYYGGRYWGGGPWWGWGPSLTDRVMGGVNGCPVPWETGACG